MLSDSYIDPSSTDDNLIGSKSVKIFCSQSKEKKFGKLRDCESPRDELEPIVRKLSVQPANGGL